MPKPSRRRATNRITPRRVRRGVPLHAVAADVMPVAPAVPRELWRARRPKLVALACTFALVTALIAFFNLDPFYVYDMQVTGLSYLGQAEVEKASGISGYNIFFVEPQAVERALVRLPEIKAAYVSVSLPNRVVVDVEERQPTVTWLRGAETYWVDDDDIAFLARARKAGPPLASVRDLDQSPVKPGQKLTLAGVAAARALSAAWPDGPRTLEWSADRGLAFNDEHGWKIYLGDASEMAGKFAKYRAIVAQLAAANIRVKFIDLGRGDPYYQ